MSVLGKTKIGVSATSLALILAMTFAPAAFAADGDGAPPDATPVASVTADPATDQAPAQSSESEAPSEEAPVAPVTEAPVVTEPEVPAVVEESAPALQPVVDDSSARVAVAPVVQESVALYIYPLLDNTKPASWSNSGKQFLCDSRDGSDFITTVTCKLPPEVCGAADWGYQGDKVKNWGYEGAFAWPQNIQYPTDNIGWPPIYAAQHGLLSSLIEVPDCSPPPPTDVCKNITGDQSTVPANFVQDGENCNPVPAECTASTVDASVWTTEDGAPTVGTEGIDFSTPTASDKVNWFGRTLMIPFASITGGSYTVKNAEGAIAAYDMEVFQAGSSSFATIVFEPYQNGLTGTGVSGDGTFHTYVIAPTSLVWNSKIASGEGSQAQPVTLTRMQELIPSATLIRAGLGQGRGNAGSLSTVSNFTDPACGYTEFPKTPVEPPVTKDVVIPVYVESITCNVAGTYGFPGTTLESPPVTTTDPETGTVTTISLYTSNDGAYKFVATMPVNGATTVAPFFYPIGDVGITPPAAGDDSYTVVTDEDGLHVVYKEYTFLRVAVCPTVIATPPAPVVVAPTCSADGSLPTLVAGENYTAAYDRPFDGPGAYKAVYTVTGLNKFATGKSVSYDLTVAGKTGDCPTTTVPAGNTTPTPPKLAYTGADVAGLISLAIALLSAGFILLIVKKRDAVLGLFRRIARRPIVE